MLKLELNLSTTDSLGTEERGHCRGLCLDCPPKKVAVVERWPLLEVRLYLAPRLGGINKRNVSSKPRSQV